MIINPVTVRFSRHELEAAHRVIELAIASRATGRVRRRSLEGAIESIELALKACALTDAELERIRANGLDAYAGAIT